MDVALIPCSCCKRHVRRDEDACPFCAARVPADVHPAPEAPRLGRAAVFLFATTVVGGLTTQACKGSPTPQKATEPAAIVASYGGPPGPAPAESCPPAASASGSSM